MAAKTEGLSLTAGHLSAFGRHIRRLIRRAGYPSRSEFLRAAGLENTTLNRWERGQVSRPSHERAEPAARALGVTLPQFYGDEPLDEERRWRAEVERFLQAERGKVLPQHADELRQGDWPGGPVTREMVYAVWRELIARDAGSRG